MSTQEVTGFKMKWCWCRRDLVEHEYIGQVNFGRTIVQVYRCPKCQSLKCIQLTMEGNDNGHALEPEQDGLER